MNIAPIIVTHLDPPKFSSFFIIDNLIYYISSKFTKKELGKMCRSPKKYLSLFRECDSNQTDKYICFKGRTM